MRYITVKLIIIAEALLLMVSFIIHLSELEEASLEEEESNCGFIILTNVLDKMKN